MSTENALVVEGFYPVQLIRNTAGSHILLGEFPSWLDAKWYQLCFEKRGIKDLVIQRSLTLENSFKNSAPQDFYLFGNDLSKNTGVTLDLKRKEIMDFEKLRAEKNYPGCAILVDNILSSAKADDAIRGWATLKKAYLAYRDGRHDDSLSYFLQVAKGELRAPLDLRLEAMNRAARVYLKKANIVTMENLEYLVKFYRGLSEVQASTDDFIFKAQLQADRAWIIMEAARRPEKYGGIQDDARMACQKVLQMVTPEQAPRTCALAELMYMESFAYEKRPEIAIQLAEKLIEKYPNQLREKAMALCFLGVLEYKRGNLEKGYQWLEKVHHLGIDPKNQAPVSFGRIYPLRHSAIWLKTIAKDMQREDLVDYWDQHLRNN